MPTGYVTAILVISVLHQVFFAIFREANVIKIGALAVLPAGPFWVFTTIILIPLAILTIRQYSWKRNNKLMISKLIKEEFYLNNIFL